MRAFRILSGIKKIMKETVYIFSNGRLKRKDNTLFFETEEGDKKFIPVENTKEIYMFGEVDFNAKALNFFVTERDNSFVF